MSLCQELGAQPPLGFWDPVGFTKDFDSHVQHSYVGFAFQGTG